MTVEFVKLVEDDTPDFEEFPAMQAIIDQAYHAWRDHKDWDYPTFLSELSEMHRWVVTLKNLNYQVTNGGFFQWWENGYHCNLEELFRMLETLKGKCPLVAQIDSITRAAARMLQDFDLETDDYEQLCSDLDPHELAYYELEEEWLGQLENVCQEAKASQVIPPPLTP